jgi:hypothetical protein
VNPCQLSRSADDGSTTGNEGDGREEGEGEEREGEGREDCDEEGADAGGSTPPPEPGGA